MEEFQRSKLPILAESFKSSQTRFEICPIRVTHTRVTSGRIPYDISHDYRFIVKFFNYNFIVNLTIEHKNIVEKY